MRSRKKSFILFLAVLLPGVFLWMLLRPFPGHEPKMKYGMTFSKIYSEKLNGDWKTTYAALLDELGVRRMRLSAYWSEIEKEEGVYDFSDLDWQVNEATKRNAEVILAVGQKLPRWPECHIPEWASTYSKSERQERLLGHIEAVIRRYQHNPSITMWQVENEPFLPFGECPALDEAFLLREVALVHSLDRTRSILLTDSGEIGRWTKAARIGDEFGTTMYFQ
ncbi:MAG: beta-galactosidase, partial [Candidatus Sungbacteria bacterium]|nr:beta-galactosidase [Candidatus Sungbacteria bacterium]